MLFVLYLIWGVENVAEGVWNLEDLQRALDLEASNLPRRPESPSVRTETLRVDEPRPEAPPKQKLKLSKVNPGEGELRAGGPGPRRRGAKQGF